MVRPRPGAGHGGQRMPRFNAGAAIPPRSSRPGRSSGGTDTAHPACWPPRSQTSGSVSSSWRSDRFYSRQMLSRFVERPRRLETAGSRRDDVCKPIICEGRCKRRRGARPIYLEHGPRGRMAVFAMMEIDRFQYGCDGLLRPVDPESRKRRHPVVEGMDAVILAPQHLRCGVVDWCINNPYVEPSGKIEQFVAVRRVDDHRHAVRCLGRNHLRVDCRGNAWPSKLNVHEGTRTMLPRRLASSLE